MGVVFGSTDWVTNSGVPVAIDCGVANIVGVDTAAFVAKY